MRIGTLGRLAMLLVLVHSLIACRLPSMISAPTKGDDARSFATGLAPGPTPEALPETVPDLDGRVLFAAKRDTLAALSEVAIKATVSLIHTGTNETVATTVTGTAGAFSLRFSAGFKPDPSATYYLEAVKGLGDNMPGHNVARVRTVAQFQRGGWVTLSNSAPNAGIVVAASTTAIAIGGALKGVTDFTPYLGTIPQGDLAVFAGDATLSHTDAASIEAIALQCLADDEDPMAKIGLSLDGTWVRPSQALVVNAINPSSGGAGTAVTLSGGDFIANATVRFNGGATTTAFIASMNTFNATVPQGAISGQTAIQMGNLSILGPLFTVPVTIGSFSPTVGGAGDIVTVTGTGFATDKAYNLVKVNGVDAEVTLASATSLKIKIPASTSGTISVSVVGQSATSATTFFYKPVLTDLNPSIAVTGSVLTLEGFFGPTVKVNFPGVGAPVDATLLGPNRAKVTVPANATGGDLTVQTAGTTTNALPFRRIGHGLGLHHPRLYSSQGENALYSNYLPDSRGGPASIVIGNYLYVLGGRSSTTSYTGNVSRALINADGTTGNLIAAGSLSTARSGHSCAVVGNYLYVIGGYNGGYLNSVERALINADGTLGSFTPFTSSSLFTSRSDHASVIVGSYLYLIGGFNESYLYDMERATLNSDGTIGPFAPVPGASLATPRGFHSAVTLENYLYLVGGANNAGSLNSVERAPINPDGTLGAFAAFGGSTLSTPRSGHSATIIGDYLYLFGGKNGASVLSSIERAPISAGGVLGAFSAVGGILLPTAMQRLNTLLVGSHLLIIGGESASGSGYNTLYRASILASGAIGAFSSAGNIGTQRSDHATVASRGFLYVVGGYNGSYLSSIERASINPDGTLGTFTTVGNLGTARASHSCVVSGSYLYAIGGKNGTGALSSVEYAPINSDGSLGSFASGPSLQTKRFGHTSVVTGNYLHVIGGNDGTSDLISNEYASYASSTGLLNSFSGEAKLIAARSGHASVILGNYLYVFDGGTFTGVHPATASAGPGTITLDETRTGSITSANPNPTKSGTYCVDFDIKNVPIGTYITLDHWGSGYDAYLQLVNKATGAVLANDDDSGDVSNAARIGFYVDPGINYVARATTLSNGSTGTFTLKITQYLRVERSPVTNGSLGDFAPYYLNSPLTLRREHRLAVVGEYLYLLGGYNNANGSLMNSVERALINSDGTYGAFSAAGINLTTTRRAPTSTVIGNFLYVIGGYNGAHLNTIDRSQL
ncbi:IPT/TIG domain-containing protein [bacterium]|nr:IPT/TIG domain-containing protein [bacterium]